MSILAQPPGAWVQWHGTNVCLDVVCGCGHRGHIDGWFAFHIECSKCGATWKVDPEIRLVAEKPDRPVSEDLVF